MTPFQEALGTLAAKRTLPTSLGSAQLRTLDASVRRQSLFSARTTMKEYLDELRRTLESLINPQQEDRSAEGATQTVTVGYNPATALEALRQELFRLGYSPTEGTEGTLKDLSSDARLDLVVRTNTELAQGAGHFVQQNDPATVQLYPALELVRFEEPAGGAQARRNWENRWRIAARAAGDPAALTALEQFGRMVALKESGIWAELGSSANFDDALDNPYPPFAFNSGMWTQDVGYADAVQLELLSPGEQANPANFNLATLFGEVAA